MNLLVIGAEGHGRVVAEVAAACGYQRVDFLDDRLVEGVVGTIEEIEAKASKYDSVIVAIGNNKIRAQIQARLEAIEANITTLIHPTAYISPSATVCVGTVIEPKAIVNAHSSIGKGCIISVGSIVDHDVMIENFVHINAGAICKAGSHIESGRKLEAGEIVHGYT